MTYTKQTPETEARSAAHHEAAVSERAAARELLTRQLAAWCSEHATEIGDAVIELAALRQRIETLCDRADADLSDDTCHRVWTANLRIALRAALAGGK